MTRDVGALAADRGTRRRDSHHRDQASVTTNGTRGPSGRPTDRRSPIDQSIDQPISRYHVLVTILVLLGSVRRGRQSARVAAFVMQRLARVDGVESTLADLDALDVPVMEERLGRIEPTPPGVAELAAAIDHTDALVIVSPEYNHGYPGALKNTLDYLLPQFKRKPVALVTVSAGGHGGVNAWAQLVTVLVNMGAIVLPQTVAVSKVQEAFSPEGQALEPAYERRVDGMLAELVWLTGKLTA